MPMQHIPGASSGKGHAAAPHDQARPATAGRTAAQPPTPLAPNHGLPEQLDALLQALPLQASPGQRAQLLDYLTLLQRWNRIYNLTAVRDLQQMLTVHLADCLAMVPSLTAHKPKRLLDVGSGGGLPGLVLAIMLPELDMVLNDAVQKKCAFLQQATVELRLPHVRVFHGRVEGLKLPAFDCITSRAFSDLKTLLQLTSPLLAEGGCWAAMKGHVPDAELAALPDDMQARVELLSVPGLHAQRCVVWMLRRSNSATAEPAAPTKGM
jgi:16S rRNA (guanine527-N7)-methyltransferase